MAHPNRIAYYRDRCTPPLKQADLAHLLDVHPNTVQNWERQGVARPEALLRLAGVFIERGALTTYGDALAFWEAAARDTVSPPPELRLLFARGPAAHEGQALALPLDRPPAREALARDAVPYPPNPHFIGRDADLRVLAALLRPERALVAICGIGGLGKTQVVVELAHRYGPLIPGGVCWIDAAEPSGIPGQIAAWTGQSGHRSAASLSFERRLALAQEVWREPTPRLLIFDNCESPAALFEWVPPSGGCRVLVTSRTRAWAAYPQVAILDLQPLERRESLELLRMLSSRPAPSAQDLDAIAAILGDLPLALHLAGKHLARAGSMGVAYVTQLQAGYPLRHASLRAVGPSPTAYTRYLDEVIHHTYQQLGDSVEDIWGRRVLAVLRHLTAGVPVPKTFLHSALGGPADAQTKVAAVARLSDDLGIIEHLRESGELRVHPVVHAYLAELPTDQASYSCVVQAVVAGAEAAVAANEIVPVQLMTHWRHVADQAEQRGAHEGIELCQALAWPLACMGHFQAARHYAERAVELSEQRLGPQHPTLAAALNVRALIEQITGAFVLAEAAFLRALAIWEHACGPTSEEVATVSNNLGALALRSGRNDEAERHLRRALRIRRANTDLQTHGTARIIHNLGHLALQQGQIRRANRYLSLALAWRQRILPEVNAATAFTLALLGEARLAAGDLAGATAYAREALAMRQAVGGADVGASLGLLGRIAQATGDLAGAATLVEQALKVRVTILGPQAWETMADMALLGGIYRKQGRNAEARVLLDQAIAGLVVVVGENSVPLAQARAERACLG